MKNASRTIPLFIAAFAVLLGGIVLSLSVGAIPGYDPEVFWILRVPRVVSAIAVGGGLAVAGALIQASLGNPLAEPYTVGVASAAALGAVLGSVGGTLFGWAPFDPAALAPGAVATGIAGVNAKALFPAHPLLSAGAVSFAFAIAAMLGLRAWLRKSFAHATEVLLAGVVASFFFSALAALVLALADPAAWGSAMHWIMGTLGRLSLSESVAALVVVTFLSLVGWAHWKPLDLLSVNELTATSAGVDASTLRRRIFAIVALMTAMTVSAAGIIGFVGLIIPHMVRKLGVRGHLPLIPLSFVLGAGLLLCSDVLARVVVRPSEIPVGIIMAIVGAPVFLALVRRHEA